MNSCAKTMTKSIGVFCFSVFLFSCTSQTFELSSEKKDVIELEIRASFNGLVEASKSLDPTRYIEYFDADKFVGLNSDGTNFNSIEDLIELIEPGFGSIEKITSLEFTNIKISVIDKNTAILVNEYEQSALLKSGVTYTSKGGGTQVWSKATGSWKLVSVSASDKPI